VLEPQAVLASGTGPSGDVFKTHNILAHRYLEINIHYKSLFLLNTIKFSNSSPDGDSVLRRARHWDKTRDLKHEATENSDMGPS
jgi:hypothetical protein